MDEYQLLNLTITDAVRLIKDGQITPLDLMEATLARIDRLNGKLNAYLHIMRDEAVRQARYATEAIRRSEDWGALHGIPIAVKDLIDIAGEPTTAGSEFLRHNIATEDAAVTTQLRAAGAIIVGKTNLHEYAVGATNSNPHYGPARNPWNDELSPGGSSGGSGAAVAALMCAGALGTDTGGSVRIPSALCGLTGLRPGKGRVSSAGVIPMSWTLDAVGPMARSAADVALMLDVLDAGVDRPALAQQGISAPVTGMKLGVVIDPYFWNETDVEIVQAVRTAIDRLGELGLELVEVRLEILEEALRASQVISISEALAYHKDRIETQPEKFGVDVRGRLESAQKRTAVEYALARQTGREWRRRLRDLFRSKVDLLIMPTTQTQSPKLEGIESVGAGRPLLRFNYPYSLSYLPALSAPCGFSNDGLPIGMQLVGPRESTVLAVSHAYQQVTDWHTRRPVL
jgi:aspartyl-tRNA(Asn)/glutamyl-tRNA(Gln) amidotransferase subunit A